MREMDLLYPNMRLSYQAMMFAIQSHGAQTRKYTNEPYFFHLAEVAGLVSTLYPYDAPLCIAWLHDILEDTSVSYDDLSFNFGKFVADGVLALSDLEKGNRATRKKLARERLSNEAQHIQNIKVCDLISNTRSIMIHDPKFAKVYCKELSALIPMLDKANTELIELLERSVRGIVI